MIFMNLEKYTINRSEEEYITPEETLIDSMSSHSTIETPISRGVFGYFYIVIIIVFAFFFLKSFQLQIIDGERLASLAKRNSSSSYPLSSLRGIIYDNEGQPLVQNIPRFELVAVHSMLPEATEELDSEIDLLASVIEMDKEAMLNTIQDNRHQATSLLKRNLSRKEVLKIKTMTLPGIYVIANSQRNYLDGAAVGHLLGYTTMVSGSDLERDDYYLITDRIGRLGLEAQYEEELNGEHRTFDFIQNEILPAESGYDLFLNINQKIQNQLYKSLVNVFSTSGVSRGAAVIQNPKTGSVLGLVSMPTFDGNIFENSADTNNSSRVLRILNSSNKPLLNRVIGGRYSPGSTIKPFLALAGLKEGVVTTSTVINAKGSISIQSEVDPSVFYTFRDWKVHGLTDIKKAISDSVDIYFYILGGGYGDGSGLGIDRISSYLKGAKADSVMGIDLPGEVSGFVPTREWKKETKGESWYVGDTYNISIGQGDLLVTPIWINTYIGAIANGGDLMKPYIVGEIKDSEGGVIQSASPEVIAELPFDDYTMSIVKQGMRQTITSGTATLLQGLPVQVAAKTGTVQVNKGLNSLFTAFGPYEDPEISVTVLVENIDDSQGLAIRVANDFLLWYFNEFKKE